MAVEYRYERVAEDINGIITTEVVVFDPDPQAPEEQTLLSIEFPQGTNVATIESKVSTYANIIGSLSRS